MKNQDRARARKADALQVDQMVGRILALWNEAEPWMLEAGAAWYDEARAWARDRAAELGIEVEIVAAVMAAFSPRTKWIDNLVDADNLLRGKAFRPGAMRANRRRALAALELGLAGLGQGPKVRAFAANILGDRDAVTVDRWAARVAFGIDDLLEVDRQLGWAGAYDKVAEAYRKAAAEVGVEPHHMQAAVWIAARGKAD